MMFDKKRRDHAALGAPGRVPHLTFVAHTRLEPRRRRRRIRVYPTRRSTSFNQEPVSMLSKYAARST